MPLSFRRFREIAETASSVHEKAVEHLGEWAAAHSLQRCAGNYREIAVDASFLMHGGLCRPVQR